MKKCVMLVLSVAISSTLFAQYDWDNVSVPAEANNADVTWQLVPEMSDDFNYESISPTEMGEKFHSVWRDGFLNAWTGPANTYWNPAASFVTNGNLEITASRYTGTRVNFQAVTSKAKIKYPAYIETRMKVMNSVMANAVWLLNDKSTEEIDIVEAYGASYSNSAQKSTSWYAQRMHLSHHTFIRSPFADYQPTDGGSWHYDGTNWRDDFRTVGVYWRDPFHLEYYIDGKLVRTVDGAAMIDPKNHLGGNGLSEEETLIISGASQGWQVDRGIYPTDDELAILADNVFKVDWVRTYKRVGGNAYIPASIQQFEMNEKVMYTNPVADYITIKADAQIEKINFYNTSGSLVKSVTAPSQGTLTLNNLQSGIYIMKVIDISGEIASSKVIKQ